MAKNIGPLKFLTKRNFKEGPMLTELFCSMDDFLKSPKFCLSNQDFYGSFFRSISRIKLFFLKGPVFQCLGCGAKITAMC